MPRDRASKRPVCTIFLFVDFSHIASESKSDLRLRHAIVSASSWASTSIQSVSACILQTLANDINSDADDLKRERMSTRFFGGEDRPIGGRVLAQAFQCCSMLLLSWRWAGLRKHRNTISMKSFPNMRCAGCLSSGAYCTELSPREHWARTKDAMKKCQPDVPQMK